MSNFLIERFHYKREDMVILTDDQANPVLQPTKQNILRAMNWLVNGAQPNDSLFFHYSGPDRISQILELVAGVWIEYADTLFTQGMVARPRTSTATKRTGTTRSSIQLTSSNAATSSMMRSIPSSWPPSSLVSV